jgi:hypothetical protein
MQVFENSFLGDGLNNSLNPEEELIKIGASTLVLWSDKNPGKSPVTSFLQGNVCNNIV